MYCDANGHPDPNGDYQMMDGKMVLRDGRRAHFSIGMFRDGAPASTVFIRDGAVMLNDAERVFADSGEGQSVVARAKHAHYLRTAYLGDRAPEFTDQQAVAAIRTAVADRARQQQFLDQCKANEAQAKAACDAAYEQMKRDLSTRYTQR